MRALRQRPTTLERWPKGVHPGIVLSHARGARRRRLLPEARPARARLTTSRRRGSQFPSGRTPTRSARPRSRWSAGARRWGRSPSTRGRCARDDVDHPDELRIDLDPQPGTDFDDAVRVAAEARELLADLGYAGFPKTSGGRGVHIYVRIEPRWTFTDVRHAAIAFGRELERRLPGRGDDEVVEGGARRAHLRRLQPERARPHDRVGLQHPAEAGRAGVGAVRLGRAAGGRARGLHGRARCPRGSPSVGDLHAAIDDVAPLAPAAARPVRARRGEGEATCPIRPTTRRCRASPSASSRRATATASARAPCGSFFVPRLGAGRDGGGTTGPMSPSGASSRSTITGAWSLGPCPCGRAGRPTRP